MDRYFCNDERNEGGFKLLEFATVNDLVLAKTFGHHKASRRWTGIAKMDNTTIRLVTF